MRVDRRVAFDGASNQDISHALREQVVGGKWARHPGRDIQKQIDCFGWRLARLGLKRGLRKMATECHCQQGSVGGDATPGQG